MEKTSTDDNILSISINQNNSLFSIGTETGFRIFRIEPLKSPACCCRKQSRGGLRIVELLYSTNIIAMVGGGILPKFSTNKTKLWDLSLDNCALELEFNSLVLSVRLTRERLIIVLARHTCAYILQQNPILLANLETCDNSMGLASISTESDPPILAIPGRTVGQVQIVHLSSKSDSCGTFIIVAHNSPLACLQISKSGNLLASASEKGTLIRIWAVSTCKLLHEFRRGSDKALIQSIAFSADETRIAVSSDKGTVHIFNLIQYVESSNAAVSNRQSVLSSFSPFLPKYFSSEWSFASFTIPVDCKCIVTFTKSDMAARYENDVLLGSAFANDDSAILAICSDGSIYKFRMDLKKGGDCILESFYIYWRNCGLTDGSFKDRTNEGSDDFWDDFTIC